MKSMYFGLENNFCLWYDPSELSDSMRFTSTVLAGAKMTAAFIRQAIMAEKIENIIL